MDALLGFATLAVLLGIGSARWRHNIREWWTERQEWREMRRKHDY
jgi:hypothetical protein